jgi:hypothetical protein
MREEFFMNDFFHEKNKMIWGIGFCVYVGMIFFLLVSLVSYNVTDTSLFYVSSEGGNILNQGGFIGAQVAALLYYLFGGAAFLLLIPLICIGLLVATNRTIKTDGERLIASLALVIIGAMVLSTYLIDVAWSPYPGGIVGLRFSQKLLYYFDPLGQILFLYVSLCASLIVLFRWSFMFLVQQVTATIAACYAAIKKHQVVSKIAQAVVICLHVLFVRAPRSFIQFMQSLIDGC